MKGNKIIQEIENEQLKTDIPQIKIGDTLDVHIRIIEGEKERIQVFNGIVIAKRGAGLSETISLYRVSYGSGIERVFMLHSPLIAKIEVVKRGKVRKAKLHYLRGIFGKKAKVKEKIGAQLQTGSKAVLVSSETSLEEKPS
ncbi:MAG: 50S ribosomal protein L19 [Chlamydiae bacterium]|nr:50S ribosomal protein L19 [Chlamydiota bacterium]